MSNNRYHNELEQSWRKLKQDHPEVAKAIEESERPQYLDYDGTWKCYKSSTLDLMRGGIYRAPVVEKQPLGPEDIKQGDVLKLKSSKNWDWFYVVPYAEMVMDTLNNHEILYSDLVENYEIRSIGGEWRGAYK